MTSHARIRRLMEHQLIGRPLSGVQARTLHTHLKECGRCRTHYHQLSVGIDELTEGDSMLGQRARAESLFEQVYERTDLGRQTAVPAFPMRRWAVRGVLVAAALLVALLLPRMMRSPSGPEEISNVRGGAQRLPAASLGISGVDYAGMEYEAIHSDGVCPDHALRFYARVRDADHRYAFVFGVQDGDLEPTWYFPNEEEGFSYEVPADSDEPWMFPFEIPLKGTHEAGSLQIIAVFGDSPIAIGDILDVWNEVKTEDALPRTLHYLATEGLRVEMKTIELSQSACEGGTP